MKTYLINNKKEMVYPCDLNKFRVENEKLHLSLHKR
jgi:hypothetical protein